LTDGPRTPKIGDLQATTRYIKVLDEEDSKAAEVLSAMLGMLPRLGASTVRDARCGIPER
jgi:hypothetical protein